MQLNWDDLRTVWTLVEEGTLTAAGERLGINYTTVARRITRVETQLGRLIFERHPDGYVPRPDALDLAEAARRMADEEHVALRKLAGRDEALSGGLTFTTPQLLLQYHLLPVLSAFTEAHPKVDLVVRAGFDLLDLSRRQADLALRISENPPEHLIGTRLARLRRACYARADLCDRARKDPAAPLDWLLHTDRHAVPAEVLSRHPNAQVRSRCDDVGALISMAQAGMGGVRLPIFLGAQIPDLVELAHIPREEQAGIWMLNHADLQGSAKVQALKGMFRRWFQDNKQLFWGEGA
ncbi:LysR family transcriptional regulator [Tritonibacter multivorans]|uniref:LysR family transcriptional regulator n=1 Tax=Tritonibacter multivorans TaxID=928856 RepID=UPI00071C4E3E|nr:LysR family transcriptional regulator [Tritonibacter multivorans]MDA7422365.1 LysR family transcriptional regulator [Tritonibacter multivorans]